MDLMTAHSHPDGTHCEHCLVDPKRNRSSLAAWTIAAVAVAFSLVVWFTRAGSPANAIGGLGALSLVAVLACPVMMGAMMWMMMRKGH